MLARIIAHILAIFVIGESLALAHRRPASARSSWKTLHGQAPILIGRGGDPFFFPEQTLPSFKLAAYQGADFIQLDIFLTKDKVPVCFPSLTLKDRTDILSHPEFQALKGSYHNLTKVPSPIQDDWLLVNFTLSELKTLRVRQDPEKPSYPQDFNYLFSIPTLSEVIDAVHLVAFQSNRTIGLIPTLAFPHFHNLVFPEVSHFMERTLLDTLGRKGFPLRAGDAPGCAAVNPVSLVSTKIRCGPLILLSKDKESLEAINELHTKWSPGFIELAFLVAEPEHKTPGGFKKLSQVADYLVISKEYLTADVEPKIRDKALTYDPVAITSLGGFIAPTDLIPLAHSLGLKVALFPFEGVFPDCPSSPCKFATREEELFFFFSSGADAFFLDNVGEGKVLLTKYGYEMRLNRIKSIGSSDTSDIIFFVK